MSVKNLDEKLLERKSTSLRERHSLNNTPELKESNEEVFETNEFQKTDVVKIDIPNAVEDDDDDDLTQEEKSIKRDLKEPKWFNKEDYWPIWVGVIWYGLFLLMTYWELDIAKVQEWENWESFSSTFAPYNLGGMLLIIFGILSCLFFVHKCLGKKEMLVEYIVLNLIVFLAKIVGAIKVLKKIGLGDSIWAIFLGIAIRNIFNKQYNKYFKDLMSMEFFIKVSIVLLVINVKQIANDGPRGILVSWVETTTLMTIFYFIGTKILKMSADDSIITSAGFSICGSSAALAIVSSIKCDRKPTEALIVFMSLLTIPFIPLVPFFGNRFNFNHEVIGSWIGGSVDSTGAVFASSVLGGEEVVQTAIIIKMLQNVIIGPICLVIVAIWFRTVNVWILWDKFPKFLLGFIFTCLVTSLLPQEYGENVVPRTFIISEWFSCISFVQIGMDIELSKMPKMISEYRKILILYSVGQIVDTFTTLGVSYLMYS